MTDPSTQRIRERIVQRPTVTNPRYQIINDAVFYREGRDTHEWKPVLPACLEERVLQYAHTSLGHLGVEKCMQQIKPLRNRIFRPPKWRTGAYRKPVTLECKVSRSFKNIIFRTPKRWRDAQRYPGTLEPRVSRLGKNHIFRMHNA
jgi:hypothetical protein